MNFSFKALSLVAVTFMSALILFNSCEKAEKNETPKERTEDAQDAQLNR